MNYVYVIEGKWCEWSDHMEWHVASYTTKEQADKHLKRLKENLKMARNRKAKKEERNAAMDRVKELDPNAPHDVDEDTYAVIEIPLFRHLDEFLEAP